VGSCALYISLRPYFSRWNGSPSLVTLGYWICAGVLFAASVAPMTHSILGLIGSGSMTALLVYGILSSPTTSDPVNHPLSRPVLVTMLIFAWGSLLLSLGLLEKDILLWTWQEHNQPVMNTKKAYTPPRLTAYDPKNVPEWLNLMQQDLLKAHVPPTYTVVVDQDRKYVQVSESFCELVGYNVEELIGTQYDHVTALNTADIPTTHTLVSKLGYMHGLWMFVHRTGYRILVRYEAWLRPDKNIQSNIEVVQTFG
jgi:PAS domain S-box-containing protein